MISVRQRRKRWIPSDWDTNALQRKDKSDVSEMRQAHRNKNVSQKELIGDAVDLLEDAIVYKWNNPNK